jgi:hypothetical protein
VHVSRLPHRVFPAAIAALAAALAFPATGASVASHPLTTGLAPSAEVYAGDPGVVFDRMHAAGMSSIDVAVDWVSIAPAGEPASWRPADPSDPHYDWSSSDARVQAVARAGFQPVIVVATAPTWARMVPTFAKSAPQPEDFAAFMHAAAERYSGRRPGLPRVRYWRIWSEPNISVYFKPQFNQTTKKFVSPDIYRNMVNRSAAEIHAVNKDNVVIAGGTAPFRDIDPQVLALDKDWGPLKFMRRLLCVSDSGRPTCASRVSFDIWSTHPYTSGGPTHHAKLRYDVSLGDLPEMRATLAAAVKAGHVVSTQRVRFWVTEFGWDSNKPDPCAVPLTLLKRWVPEAMYRMWANGIEHVSWFRLMDDPLTVTIFQSGLFFNARTIDVAKPKPFIEGFRFPFVALRRGKLVYVWAHTPLGRPARVTVQQTFSGGWRTVKTLRTDRYGIAQASLHARASGQFRAVLAGGERSLPFSMRVPRDRFFNPFGRAVLTPTRPNSCTG